MPVSEEELKNSAVAPRVTLAQVEGAIESEHFFTAADGHIGHRANNGVFEGTYPATLGLLTFCVLVLKNGFTVTGQSACADPANFNEEIGRRISRDNAVRQIWPLLGYELRTKLSQADAS